MPGGSVFTGPGGPIDKFPASHPYRELVDPIVAIETVIAGGSTPTLPQIYPVGSIYLSAISTNPATTFGFGTWSAIGQGRVLMGVGTGTDIHSNTLTVTEGSGGDTVGEYKHTLSEAELATHDHGGTTGTGTTSTGTTGGHVHGPGGETYFLESGGGSIYNATGTGANAVDASTATASATDSVPGLSVPGLSISNDGSNNAHNNVQPYFGVYAWQRTA